MWFCRENRVGDGVAIKPAGNKMVAPCDGTIGKIFETNHAFIESDTGIELLFISASIRTRQRFHPYRHEGQQVDGDTYQSSIWQYLKPKPNQP